MIPCPSFLPMAPYCCLKNMIVRKKEIEYLEGKQRLWVHPLFFPKGKVALWGCNFLLHRETSLVFWGPHQVSWFFMLSRGSGLLAKLWLMCWLETLWYGKFLVRVALDSCAFARLLNELWGWILLPRTLGYCWVWYDLLYSGPCFMLLYIFCIQLCAGLAHRRCQMLGNFMDGSLQF